MTKDTAKRMLDRARSALQQAGLNIGSLKGKYTSGGELRLAVVLVADGADPGRKRLESYAPDDQINPDAIGPAGERLVDYNPRASHMPYVLALTDGRRARASAQYVRGRFRAPATAEGGAGS